MSHDPHEQLVYTLNDEQWAQLTQTMQNPRPPTPAMIDAARKMLEWAERPGKLEYDSWSIPQCAAPSGKIKEG